MSAGLENTSVLSIQLGKPRTYRDADGKEWSSSIAKERVDGRVRVFSDRLEGDQQADTKHHGGKDKAILVYAERHYCSWATEFREFSNAEYLHGAFGENLTVSQLDEESACIGDVMRIGTALLQVSQPRQPCWKLSRRWNIPKLAAAVQKAVRTGWYLRVLQQGTIEAGDSISLLERPHAEWSIAAAHRVMYAKPRDAANDLRLAECQSLSESWKLQLRNRAQ